MNTQFKAHNRNVRQLAISPDEMALVSGDADGNVYQWDMETVEQLRVIRKDTREGLGITRLAFSPDGTRLAVGITYSLIQGVTEIYNTRTWSIASQFETHEIYDLAWSPDGNLLAIASGEIFIVDMHLETIIKTIGADSALKSVAFDPKGNFLVTGGDFYRPSMRLWSTGTFTQNVEVPNLDEEDSDSPLHDPYRIQYISSEIVMINNRNGVMRWDIKSGKITTVFEPHTLEYYYAHTAISPDGKLLAYESIAGRETYVNWFEKVKDKEWPRPLVTLHVSLHIHELPSDEELFNINEYDNRLTSIIFNADGTKVITGDTAGYINIWDLTECRDYSSLIRHN